MGIFGCCFGRYKHYPAPACNRWTFDTFYPLLIMTGLDPVIATQKKMAVSSTAKMRLRTVIHP
jgi:hypothetical protein